MPFVYFICNSYGLETIEFNFSNPSLGLSITSERIKQLPSSDDAQLQACSCREE